MFFLLSKILAFLIQPISWVFLMLLITLKTRHPRKKRRRFIFSLALLYAFSNPFLLDEVMRSWEVQTVKVDQLEHQKVGVILGGFTQYDPEYDRVEFSGSVDRLMMAYQLYQQGTVEKLIISGGSSNIVDTAHREGDNVRNYLDKVDFPMEDLWVDRQARNTYENAVFTKKILRENGLLDEPFILITSARHMRRSMAIYEKQGMKFIPFSVDRHSGPRKFDIDHLLIPTSGTLNKWGDLMHEWVGYISYWAAGYL